MIGIGFRTGRTLASAEARALLYRTAARILRARDVHCDFCGSAPRGHAGPCAHFRLDDVDLIPIGDWPSPGGVVAIARGDGTDARLDEAWEILASVFEGSRACEGCAESLEAHNGGGPGCGWYEAEGIHVGSLGDWPEATPDPRTSDGSEPSFGALNGHAAGIIMKELVRRAISTARAEMLSFEVQKKVGYGGDEDDLKTSVDVAAQKVYLRSLRECFPTIGIVAEEDELRVPCTEPGMDAYFTVDPVDGTRALVRRQSHGIGTMLALVVDGEVVSGWVGDLMTQEVYGYRPGSEKVHRIREYGIAEELVFDTATPLSERYLLLHDPVRDYSPEVGRLVAADGLFDGYEVMGGSVGTWMARLWKGEVGAAVLPPSFETPWDSAPVIGISKKLGFAFVQVQDGHVLRVNPIIPLDGPEERGGDLIIVHRQHLTELLEWL